MNFREEIVEFMKCNINEIYLTSSNEKDTINIAMCMAEYLKKDDVISLDGELGSGKTVFMKGLANFFGIKEDVSSPTFTIVNDYSAEKFHIYHFDVYRLNNVDEFLSGIGTDYFDLGPCIIEWGKIIYDILPKNSILIDITKTDDNSREFYIRRKNI